MSTKQQALLLTSPLFSDEHPKEREEFTGFPCNNCQGNGWHRKYNNEGEWVKVPCRVCGGTGKLKAIVTIQWLPDK